MSLEELVMRVALSGSVLITLDLYEKKRRTGSRP